MELIGKFPEITVIGAVASLYGFIFWYVSNALKETTSRERLINQVSSVQSLKSKYFSYVRSILRRAATKIQGSAWSSRSYDWALRVAYCYPVTGYILNWIISGRTTVGLGAGLPDGAPLDKRLLVAICMIASVYLYDRASQANRRDWAWQSFCAVALLAFAAFFGAGHGSFVVVAAVCVASIVSINSAIRGIARRRKPFATAKVFMGGAIAGLLLAGAATVAPFATDYASGLLMVAVVASIAAIFSAGGEFATRYQLIGSFLFFQWGLFILAGAFVAGFVDPASADPAIVSLYIMWGILPFLNAPFDWISLAITIMLLTDMVRSAGSRIVRNSILDYLIAVAVLYALAFTVITVLGVYKAISLSHGHIPFVDPMAIVSQIKANPMDPSVIWVYAMLLTTLVPTLVHTTAAMASIWANLAADWTGVVKKYCEGDLANDFHRRMVATLYFSVLITVICVCSLLLGALGLGFIYLSAPYLGSGILRMAEYMVPTLSAFFGVK